MRLVAEIVDLRRRRLERPLPVVEVDAGPVVGGWVLRLLAPAAVAALLLLTGLRVGLMPGGSERWRQPSPCGSRSGEARRPRTSPC
ncbi:hypothetical protein ACNHYB_02870 [Isoptericola jiangsuensis]|uniref:hypothetical protein n=1 Tax=Isoptericola jiangsuensis TaxID=548579 RepID=UPI003AACA0B2